LRTKSVLNIWDAGVDDVREIQRVARITWDHTYRETIPESVRREFVSQAYSADALRRRIESNTFLVTLHKTIASSGSRTFGLAPPRRSNSRPSTYFLRCRGGGSDRASSKPASSGSHSLRGLCYGSSRITCVPDASTRPTVSDTPEITQ
jgi:hypothetical protein